MQQNVIHTLIFCDVRMLADVVELNITRIGNGHSNVLAQLQNQYRPLGWKIKLCQKQILEVPTTDNE